MVSDREIVDAVRDLASAWRDLYDKRGTHSAMLAVDTILSRIIQEIARELREAGK
jgi:hypothetical protein